MKRLILCCDGTWNKADQEDNGVPCPTNVVKIGYRVSKRDGAIPQVVYYDQGVGSGNILDRYTGGAFGDGLEDNIHDAYRFLVANYESGDELFLFGFSRGAFTARSIGGMVRKCGVLGREHIQHYRDAIALYRSEHRPTDPAAVKFRKDYSVRQGRHQNQVHRCLGYRRRTRYSAARPALAHARQTSVSRHGVERRG